MYVKETYYFIWCLGYLRRTEEHGAYIDSVCKHGVQQDI
jgi:hypothetical protein